MYAITISSASPDAASKACAITFWSAIRSARATLTAWARRSRELEWTTHATIFTHRCTMVAAARTSAPKPSSARGTSSRVTTVTPTPTVAPPQNMAPLPTYARPLIVAQIQDMAPTRTVVPPQKYYE